MAGCCAVSGSTKNAISLATAVGVVPAKNAAFPLKSLGITRVPLVIDGMAPGCDSYVWKLPKVPPEAIRSWSYQGSVRSFQWQDGGLVKSRLPFSSHRSADDFYGLLDDGARRGVNRPSSYGSFFHDCYRSPMVSGPARRAMAWLIPGGWESLLLPRGDYTGTWYRYDIRSAYLWALGSGLPDPASYRYTETIDRTLAGCYVVTLPRSPGAPYPYERGGTWPATAEEIERYNLRPTEVHYGVTWSQEISTDPMLKVIHSWPFWKEVARSYWGRWAALGDLECTTYRNGKPHKNWRLPPTHANPIWAHIVLGRVRARLHAATLRGKVARVYVDNIITDTPLDTGLVVGTWRLEETYSTGIRIKSLHNIKGIDENGNEER